MFSISKNSTLKRKRKLIRGLILDAEIDIEVEWMLLDRAQKQVEEAKEKIKKNTDEIRAEKEKTPIDLEKVKELVKENIALGYTGDTDKKQKEVFLGKIATLLGIVRHHRQNINSKVGEREYYKLRLKAVDRMLRTRYMSHFKEILRTEEEGMFTK